MKNRRTVHVGPEVNSRSLANFPMQANGAEMLRLACCLATERGIRVCAPVHDALLIEAPADEIEQVVADCESAMRTVRYGNCSYCGSRGMPVGQI